MKIEIVLKDSKNKLVSAASEDDLCVLSFKKRYQLNDFYEVKVSEYPCYLVVQMDPILNPTLLYMSKKVWQYKIPFSLERHTALPDGAFCGEHHYVCVRKASETEITEYRNLAYNPHDQKDASGGYPHVSANAETRGEEPFLAKNVIDGYLANNNHGKFPFQSWGIDAKDNAELKLDFGRQVNIDKIGILLRADYPHDSYWTQINVSYSNGDDQKINLIKTNKIQYFKVNEATVKYLKLNNLKRDKTSDPGTFPSLSQLVVLGKNKLQ
ncbi:hypothetical protein PT285_00460 [Lactobacillus sp. ESL0791]|uniref:hypothetical protein n=1 Tax=Lactobacillus sp. ESL0791 TaxID=2983234 RepID=UPI0023F64C3A|nr:hypothetical protein [Lactobacillus sp. ESL0791]MDF7637911.1 hypothetical protein [Lactobacillus sp. ESL0791]